MPQSSTPDPLVAALLDKLAAGADRRLNCLSARYEHTVHAVHVDQPTISVVLRGRKTVQTPEARYVLLPGDLLAMAAGAHFDAAHEPDAAGNPYQTLSFPICDPVLKSARLLLARLPVDRAKRVHSHARASLQPELDTMLQALLGEDETRASLAVLGLVMRLVLGGFDNLLLPPNPGPAARIRRWVTEDPARDWHSADFEERLNLGGATLRRHLAREHTTLRAVVLDARLNCALNWLYTTHWPLKTVASRAGYRSVESFSQRFRERFGLDPSAIGNAADG